MIEIDGSAGEGGGQVLRTALGLSLVSGEPFHITRIRGGRSKPGLLNQHLTCVNAATVLGAADVRGDTLGSSELTFTPQARVGGHFTFRIGTAGSTTLVLQAILPALLTATEKTHVTISGGTHNDLAPPFEFLDRTLAPLLRTMGADISVTLLEHGFEPVGGGSIEIEVHPAPLRAFTLTDRGPVVSRQARALLSSVPEHVAQRELSTVREVLKFLPDELRVEHVRAKGPGNVLLIELVCQHVTAVFIGFGKRGVTAEQVARRTCGQVKKWLESGVPVDQHLADQLIVPMAIAGGGHFDTVELTPHAQTQLELVPRFLPVKCESTTVRGGIIRVRVN